MADPLSVTASIISLLGFALHGSKRLSEFIDSLRGAPSDIAALSIDLKALYEVLAVLAGMQDELERSGSLCDCLRTPLENCVNIFEEFTIKLRSYTTTTRDGKVKVSMWKNITWAFKEKEIQLFRGTMTSYKASLDLAIGAITLSSTTSIGERTKRIEVDLKEGMSHIRAKLEALDVDHIESTSIMGAKGSEWHGTDAGFALGRFINYEGSLHNSVPSSFPGSPNASISDPSNDFDTTLGTLDSESYFFSSNRDSDVVIPILAGIADVANSGQTFHPTRVIEEFAASFISWSRDELARGNVFDCDSPGGQSHSATASTLHYYTTLLAGNGDRSIPARRAGTSSMKSLDGAESTDHWQDSDSSTDSGAPEANGTLSSNQNMKPVVARSSCGEEERLFKGGISSDLHDFRSATTKLQEELFKMWTLLEKIEEVSRKSSDSSTKPLHYHKIKRYRVRHLRSYITYKP